MGQSSSGGEFGIQIADYEDQDYPYYDNGGRYTGLGFLPERDQRRK